MQTSSRTKLIEESEGIATKIASLDLSQTPTPFVDRQLTKVPSWTYSDVATMKRLLSTITISTEDTTDTTLWSFDFSPDNLVKYFGEELQTHFGLLSAKINFEIQIQSHFTQLGAMLVTFSNAPSSINTLFGIDSDALTTNPFLRFRLPSDVITLGKSETHMYSLDWIVPIKNWTTQSTKDNAGSAATQNYSSSNGTIALSMLVPLTTTTEHPVTVRIYANLTDLQYSMWIP